MQPEARDAGHGAGGWGDQDVFCDLETVGGAALGVVICEEGVGEPDSGWGGG